MKTNIKFTAAIRHYTTKGVSLGASKHAFADKNKAIAIANSILRIDGLMITPGDNVAPLMPTNISIRGAKGRFIKWKK